MVDLLTMMLGTDQILLCARLDFDDALDAASLERACAGDRRRPARALPGHRRVFVEPVPRTTRRSGRGCSTATGRRARSACGRGSARTGLSGRAGRVCSMVALLRSHCSKATLLHSRATCAESPAAYGRALASSSYATSGRSVGAIGRGQHVAAGEVGVHPGGRGAALGDRPDDQRLPAAHVAGGEHARRRWS